MKIVFGAFLPATFLLVLFTVGCAGPEGMSAADVDRAINDKFNTVDRNLALWDIQPGLGTAMMGWGVRFGNAWFAAQKGNWDMVRHQIDEMVEIKEVAEITRPSRAPMLESFVDGFLKSLDGTARAQDLAAFITAYDATIQGCNGCHAASSSDSYSSYRFVKITRTSAPQLNNVDWAGQ